MEKRGTFADKKSQVTVFIIVSLLILVGGFFYFYSVKAGTKQIDVAEPDFEPITQYVDSCIKSAADEALIILGVKGGYIQIPEHVDRNPRSYLKKGILKMPYWWHDGIESIPSEDFMKSQLGEYTENKITECVENFEAFGNEFEIKELSKPKVSVSLNDKGTSFDVDYYFEATSKPKNLRQEFRKFTYTTDIKLKKIYGLARAIMERENEDYFFEKRTIDLYSIDRNIPTTDIQATCSSKAWRLADIRQRLAELLQKNIPYIRIANTDYNHDAFVPNPRGKDTYSGSYFQKNYVWKVTNEQSYKDLKVSFQYDSWPIQIYARPSESGILKSNARQGTNMLSFMCLHIWHFTYDISYPVLASVFDRSEKTGQSYQFSFPFMVNIDHNQPSRTYKGSTLFEAADDVTSEEFCRSQDSDITIFTVNNGTTEDITGVNLTFVCAKFYCDMGKSEWLSLGAAAGAQKRMPSCSTAIVKAHKEGFEDTNIFINSETDRTYLLFMNPVREFSFNVVKHPLSSPSISRNLEEDEQASIMIKRKGSDESKFYFYPSEDKIKLRESDETYEVIVYVIQGDSIVAGYSSDWDVKKDMAYGSEITFHVADPESKTEDEQLLFMSG